MGTGNWDKVCAGLGFGGKRGVGRGGWVEFVFVFGVVVRICLRFRFVVVFDV